MRNAHPLYMCFPSVAVVGEYLDITIFPRDISRVFREDKEYELNIMGIRIDEKDYHDPLKYDHPCRVEDGCLHFSCIFDYEQEYVIRFREKGKKETKVTMYAVADDLYERRPLKGDLHAHSYYSDGHDGVAMIPANYREEGFDFFALTDHNRMFTSEMAIELYKDIPLGMHIMKGEEVHTPDSQLHIVHVGGKNSICDKYIHDRDTYEAEVAEIEKQMEHIPELYRRRVAQAKWVCEQAHKEKGIAIFAHPFWQPRRYNVSAMFAKLLFGEKMFDAFELMGGISARCNNQQLALWMEERMKGNELPVVGSSDSHNHDFERDVFGRRFTIVFAKKNTTKAILEAIKEGYCVAGELPMNDDEEVRFYGTNLRFVLFAHFLFQNYFNETWRLCVGEGILMRRYAQGEPVGKQLAACEKTVENFYKQYFGYEPAPSITPERMAFLDKCLDLQRNRGPITYGTTLYIYGGNERRE